MEAEKAGNLSDRKLGRKLRDQLTMGWTDARHRLSTVGCRAFTVHGPMVWNALPDDLRAQQDYESILGASGGGSPPQEMSVSGHFYAVGCAEYFAVSYKGLLE